MALRSVRSSKFEGIANCEAKYPLYFSWIEAKVGNPTTGKSMPTVIKEEYIAHLDGKNRFTLRGAKTRLYTVRVFKDGHLLLSPQKLVEDPPISRETMRQIERSVGNLKTGKACGPINVKAARRLFKS